MATEEVFQKGGHALRMDGNGGAEALDLAELGSVVPVDGRYWIHLDLNNDEDLDWLENRSGLDELALEALRAESTRPRMMLREEGLLLALRGVNLNPSADPEDMVSIRIVADAHRLISTQRRRLLSIEDLLESFVHGHGPCDTGELIVDLCSRLVDRMEGTVEEIEGDVDDLEAAVLDAGDPEFRSELALQRRKAIQLHRYLSPQREALQRMSTERIPWLSEVERSRLREVNDRLIRHIENLDATRDRAALAQEEMASRTAEQLNGRMYVLSVVAAIFLPLGFLTGLLGVNLAGIPGAENRHAFLWFLAALVLIVALLLGFFFSRKWIQPRNQS